MRRAWKNLTIIGMAMLVAACQGSEASAAGSRAAAATSASPSSGVGVADAAPSPVLAWSFAGDVTTLAGDVDVELTGGAEVVDNAVNFDGRTGFGASRDLAPITTTASFSVSAWVSLSEPVEYPGAVSQLGEEAAAFYLGGGTTWGFAMKDADTNDPGHTISAESSQELVNIGEWVHLVGVHDVAEGVIRLYVDGALAATTDFDQPWQAEGELTIGRSQAHFAPADFWPGSIASVAIFDQALSSDHVRSLFQSTAPDGPPPVMVSEASTLRGTWDYVLDDAGREIILDDFAGLVDTADEVVTRIGFDGNSWWQGYLFDGELLLVDRVPEGDGGKLVLDPDNNVIVMTGAGGAARIAYEYAVDGDQLSLRAFEECDMAGPEPVCIDDPANMDPIMLLVTDQTFTRSSDDPSYR